MMSNLFPLLIIAVVLFVVLNPVCLRCGKTGMAPTVSAHSVWGR